MALSGSAISYFSQSSALYLKVVWSATQNISGNYSYVTANYYYCKSTSGALTTGGTIMGTLSTSNNSVPINFSFSGASEHLMFTLHKTVYHNSSGKASFSLTADGNIGYGNTASIIRTYTLNTIYQGSSSDPQYAYITSFGVWARSPKEIEFNYSTDVPTDYVKYRLNGGDWIDAGSTIIGGLDINRYYDFQIEVRRADSGMWTVSPVIGVTTNTISSLSSNVNFVIGETYTNTLYRTNDPDAKTKLTIYCGFNNNWTYIKNIFDATGSNTIIFTQEEINLMYSLTPNSNAIPTMMIINTYNSDYSVNYGWYTYYGTASITNANPIFSNFTYQDLGGNANLGLKTTDLTNNNQIIIKGYSNLRAIVSVANKAVAQKGATMVKYRLVVGSQQKDVNYSDSADVNLDLNAIDNNVFTIYAIDSRGNSTFKQISPDVFKTYTPITLPTGSAVRTDTIGEETTLSFNGDIWNDTFGIANNVITECVYKYKKTTDTDYIVGDTILTPTLNGSTYSLSLLIKGDDGANGFIIDNNYDIEIDISDMLTTKTYHALLQAGTPLQDDCLGHGVAFGEIYDVNEGGALQLLGKNILNLIFPVGTSYITNIASFNPNVSWVGTWTLDCIGQAMVGVDIADPNFNAADKVYGEKTHTLSLQEIPNINLYKGVTFLGGTAGNIAYASGGWKAEQATTLIGGGGSHNNIQPSKAKYIWTRTA